MLLVKPGDPDSSYLQAKLNGTQGDVGGSGDAMPPAGPDDELRSRIWSWIDQGADRN